MPQFFIARQPIFDRKFRVTAYELLYRDSETNQVLEGIDEDVATAQVLETSAQMGLDALVGPRRRAFINLPQRFIVDSDLLPFDSSRVVLEILENVEPTEEVLTGLKYLSDKGYKLALDNFVYHERYEPILPYIDVVKLDIQAIDPANWQRSIESYQVRGQEVVAQKIETEQEFEQLAEMGPDFFQGYFFARPQMVSGRKVAGNKATMLQLLSSINDPAADIDRLNELVSRDVPLSLRCLSYVNSVGFGLNRKIESVREALVYLGRNTIRRWINLFLMASADDKPDELVTMALTRAQLCKLMAEAVDDPEEDPEAYFTVGLFSILDTLMDAPMDEVLKPMSLTDDLRDALLELKGDKGQALRIVMDLEFGVLSGATFRSLSAQDIAALQIEAMNWADSVIEEMGLGS